jgi:hypothetical protein
VGYRLLLAMTQLARERMQVEDARRAEKRAHELLLDRSKSRLMRSTELRRYIMIIDAVILLLHTSLT